MKLKRMVNTTLCYIRKNDRTLMMRRNKPNDHTTLGGMWIAPGGKFELGESPEECAIREVKEETGLTLQSIKLRGILIFVTERDGKIAGNCHAFVFESHKFSGELIDSPEGELQWIYDDQIPVFETNEKDKIFNLWIYKQEKFFLAKFYSVGEKLKSYLLAFS